MPPSPSPANGACPCTSGRPRSACCGPQLDGTGKAATAEQLMRARYSAFAEGNIGFIRNTLAESARADHDEDGIRQWSEQSEWLGLKILGTSLGGETDDHGIVEFVASYRAEGRVLAHQERATFAREGGAWVFVDSETPRATTFRHETPPPERNAPCACGSGRKYKKCCGAK